MGNFGELMMKSEAGAVIVEPSTQSGPLANQRLVCNFGCALAQRDQSGISQDLEHLLDGGRVIRPCRKLGQGRPPTGVLSAFTELCQTQEHSTGDCLLLSRHGGVEHLFGRASNRAAHAAGIRIPAQGEPVAASSPPRFVQRVRKQR